MKIIDSYEILVNRKAKFEEITLPCGSKRKVYTITNIHDFVKFMGIGKYNNPEVNVFFRGQPDIFDAKMKPSLFRDLEDGGERNTTALYSSLRTKIKEIKKTNAFFKEYEIYMLEAIFQHYGLKTSYIDCVDNIWIALWFATHDVKSKVINNNTFVYYHENTRDFSYIFQIASDAIVPSNKNAGEYTGETTICYDLRKALPAFYLRPHVQHAYMIKKRPDGNQKPIADYSDLIIGIAKIPTNMALKWLGNGEILSVSTLFPSPVFDDGYELILKQLPPQSSDFIRTYGAIQFIDD